MRLGPKEKQILKKLVPGKFTPPSVYMPGYGSCPCCSTINRIAEKGLVVVRWRTLTPAERRCVMGSLWPGREAAEFNAALKPTKTGEEVIARLRAGDENSREREFEEWACGVCGTPWTHGETECGICNRRFQTKKFQPA